MFILQYQSQDQVISINSRLKEKLNIVQKVCNQNISLHKTNPKKKKKNLESEFKYKCFQETSLTCINDHLINQTI